MKTCRKPIAMVLLLLIHLLTLQIGDAGHNLTNVSNAQNDSKIILEEVIITGNGNNTRILANAVAEDTSKLDDDILSLLSKREIRRRDSTLTNSDLVDQDAAQSRTAIVNANEEDQLEADLEIMSRVIEKYEPQRLTSKKFKRKIVDGSNRTRDIHDKAAGSVTDLQRDYAEMLRNISQKTTELSLNNDDLARNSYLSQALKQLKQVYIPEVTIRSVTNDGAKKPHSDTDPSYTSPTLKNKKSRKLLKKYHQSNRTTITPRFWSSEESSSDEETAGSNESSTPAGYFKVSSGKTKPRNGSLSTSPASNSGPAERLKSRKWHIQYPPIQSVSSFTLRLNDSNANNIDANNLKNLNVPSDANAVRLPPRHSTVPRPFSALPSLNSPVTANIDASYRKPIASPRGFGQQQQQIARSSANVLPLVLPTELFSPPPARHYVPIKRAKHLNLEGNSATVVSTVANPPTSPARERTTLDYNALYTATTRSPLVTVNGQQSSSDYHSITESPAVTTVTKTNFATTYIPSQTSASYVVRQQDDSQAIRKENFLPRATTYNSPVDEKSSLNENLGVALYNKFANLHSADVPNIFNAQKAIAQDFKQPVQPTQQQVSTLPYATLKPLTSTRARPIAFSKPAPYYDGVLLVSQDIDRKLGEKSDDNVQAKVRPLVKDEDEVEEEDNDDDDDDENYKTRVNQETNIFETPNKQREKEDRKEEEEDRYPQQSRNYGYQNRDYKYENDDNSKNDDGRKEYEKARYENDDDEEEVDETEEEEHVSIGKSKDKGNGNRQYNKYKYNTDHSDEKQPEKSHYDSKKYNKPKDRHDKLDYGRDVERRFESNNKYFESLGNDDETRERNNKYRERSDKKKKLAGGQYKKDRRDHQYRESEDESIAEDKPIAQRASRQDERYEQEQNNNDKRNYRISPRRDSLREDHAHEEYGESNPTHAREEYHQLVNNDPGIDDSGDQDDDKAEARDHVHGETQEHAHKHEEHHEKKKHGGNHKFDEGGGAEHEEEHHGHKAEKGEKGYKVWHEHEKADKGHHNKEHASKHYDEKGGEEKKHEEEGEYHEEHHHGEEGKKASEFGEKGEHKKGHSTHGKHSVHKKDEFEKKTEFFDEFHDDGDIEKHGEHHHAHESKKGGHEKKGHHDIADHEEKHGKEEKHEKGGHHHEHKGHKDEEGHDHHYDNDHKYGKKEGHEHGKKWSFKKGDDGGDAGGGHKHNR